MAAWRRAVIVPAMRRVGPAWVGCAIVASQLFGGDAMHPRDLTGLALAHAGTGLALAATWLLIFVPTARVLVRQDGARYLRALPAPRWSPTVLAALALVGLQLPWVLLWGFGDGARGGAIVLGGTAAIAAVAAWRAPAGQPRVPAWRGALGALVGVHARALRRRAGDALVRGAGLAALAGAAAGLFVRNNELGDTGAAAATMGAAVIAVMLVPAVVAPLLALLEAHRAMAWLAASLGVGAGVRDLALATVVAAVQLAGTTIAVTTCALVGALSLTSVGWLAPTALVIALGTSLAGTRVLLHRGEAPRVALRATVGAVAVAAAAVLCLGVLGVPGAVGLLALGVAALGTRRA